MQNETKEALTNIIALQNNLILEMAKNNEEKENLINVLIKEIEIAGLEERSD